MAIKLTDILTAAPGTAIEIRPLAEGGREWLDFLDHRPEADICHHPAWGKVMTDTFGLDSILIVHKSDTDIDAGVPLVLFDQRITGRAMISMPYMNYGGIVGAAPEAVASVVKTCRDIIGTTGADYAEFRHVGAGLGDTSDRTIENRITFRLDINRPTEKIFESLKKQLRTRLRKVDKLELTYYRGQDRLDHFYRLFAMAMKEHGTPVMPKRFFASVLHHLADHAEIMIAYKNATPIGGKFVMTFKDRATMVWGCYPDRYKSLLANYYLTWELIQHLAGSKITTLDFGRSPKEGGGHEYKSNWGPDKIPIYTDYLAADPDRIPDLKPENAKYARAIGIWKKLPMTITKLVGPRLARYFP